MEQGDPGNNEYQPQIDPNLQSYGGQFEPNQNYPADPNQGYGADPNQSYGADPNQQAWDPNYGNQNLQYESQYPGDQGRPQRRMDEEYGEDEAMLGMLWGYVMTPHGLKPARKITLEGEGGLRVTLTNYGARITSIRMPDRYGISDEVLLGLDRINDYYRMKKFSLGCVLGRMSRPLIGIQQPDGHHIFDEMMWETCITEENHVVFTLFSPTGEQGYPSDVVATVDYWLEPGNRMLVRLTATCTAPTPLSLSLRLPFNLAGQRSGNEGLLQHRLMINARKYLEEDKDGALTGEIKRSRKEGLDFLAPIRMSDAFARGPYGGFDHHLILNGDPIAGMRFVARLSHHYSGRSVEIYSNSRCLHIDTLNNLRLPLEVEETMEERDSLLPESPLNAFRMHSSTASTRRPVGRGPSWVGPKKPTMLKWKLPENDPRRSTITEEDPNAEENNENEFGEHALGEQELAERETGQRGIGEREIAEQELGEQSGYSRSSKDTESWEDTIGYGDMRVAEDLTPQSAVILSPEDYPDTVFDKEWTYTLLPGQRYERILRFTFHRLTKPLPDSGWPFDSDVFPEEEGYTGEMPGYPPGIAPYEYPLHSRPENYHPQYYEKKDQYNPQAAKRLAEQSKLAEQSFTGNQSDLPNQNYADGNVADQSNTADQVNFDEMAGQNDEANPSNFQRRIHGRKRTGEGDLVRVSDAPIASDGNKEHPKKATRKGEMVAAAPA